MNELKLNEKIEKIKKRGISQRKIAEVSGFSQSTLSNILTNNKKVSIEKENEINHLLDDIIEHCFSIEDFNHRFGKNKKAISKNINKLFNSGKYKCTYSNEYGNISYSTIAVQKKGYSVIMQLDFEKKEYLADSEKNSFILREYEGYIEVHFTIEDFKNIHIFIRFNDYPITFTLGMMYYVKNHAPITTKVIIEYMDSDNLKNTPTDKEITRFFHNKYLSRIKLPEYVIQNRHELESKLWAKQRNKGWVPIFFNETLDCMKSFDLFISTPINSLTFEQFQIVKNEVEKIVTYFREQMSYSVYCQASNLNSKNEFIYRETLKKNYYDDSNSNVFSLEVRNAIKNSKKFIFIDIEEKCNKKNYQSAQIFQLGWTLGQSTENLVYYFVDDVEKVPILVRNQNLKNFKIVQKKSYCEILDYLKKYKSDVFSIDTIENETFVIE